MKFVFTLFVFFYSGNGYSQDISGMWEGQYYNPFLENLTVTWENDSVKNKINPFITIKFLLSYNKDSILNGRSITYYPVSGGIDSTISNVVVSKVKKNKWSIKETKILNKKNDDSQLQIFEVRMKSVRKEVYLEGEWKMVNSPIPRGTIKLKQAKR